ncbi:MAG: tRNA pseudouridine(38-40) synthase TruA [Roseburia sp.]|nr:tRNA pseudouridine(38-40) synthase TruA [Roseburia sp.]
MSNYRMAIQYDGTRYRGWQSLSDTDATIQGKLETVLSQMTGEEVAVIGSGRTDAGVHAIGQVANFHLQGTFDEHALLADLNRYLPEDIAVSSLELVDDRFHSRYQATRKTYRYRIHTGEIPEVFERKYVYDYRTPLDVGRMREAAGLLCGTHDFKSFCGNRRMKKSTVRTIYEIRVEELPGELQLYFTGDGFLQNMIRILTGTLIEIGDGRRAPQDVTRILAAKDREAAGYTAPACGLTLINVEY